MTNKSKRGSADEMNKLSLEDCYRECGFLYRHHCATRTIVLSVCLPIVFGGVWISIKENLPAYVVIIVVSFCVSMYVVAFIANRYYSSLLYILHIKMQNMEKSGKSEFVHTDLLMIMRNGHQRYDRFDWCVIGVGLFGFAMLFIF